MAELPTTRKGVPWKAVRIRKTKYAGRFGDNAVARLKIKNKAALQIKICIGSVRTMICVWYTLGLMNLQDDDPKLG